MKRAAPRPPEAIHIAQLSELQRRLSPTRKSPQFRPRERYPSPPPRPIPSHRHNDTRTDARPGAETDAFALPQEALILTPRRAKRLENRLAKHGLDFEHFEQGDTELITVRAILTQRKTGLGRAFVYPRSFVKMSGPRVIADAILSDYVRGYGVSPRVA